MKRSQQQGFTLLEMLISVAVLSTLMVVAVPNFASYMAQQDLKTTSQALYMSMVQARSESVKRNEDVYVHPADGTSWASGWYLSTSSAHVAVDCEKVETGGSVIRAFCQTGNSGINFKAAPADIRFTPGGRAELARFVICDGQADVKGRTLYVDLSGVATISEGKSCS